jgi:hypothetical protein
MEGYIGLYRCLLDKPIWKQSTPEQKTILITILLMVNHQEAEWEWQGEKFKVLPGQKITSLEKIAEASGKGISIQNVRSALLRFEKLGFLTNKSTKTGRLISIENWELYQVEFKKGNKEDSKGITKSQQTGNKEVTTNNNDKNKKNNKIFSSDSNEYRLADYLKKYILKNNPSAKVPDDLNNWAKVFDLMIRIDNRTVDDIKTHIEYSQKDEFWRTTILSASKLRKQYDQLTLKMEIKPKDYKNGTVIRSNAAAYDYI